MTKQRRTFSTRNVGFGRLELSLRSPTVAAEQTPGHIDHLFVENVGLPASAKPTELRIAPNEIPDITIYYNTVLLRCYATAWRGDTQPYIDQVI